MTDFGPVYAEESQSEDERPSIDSDGDRPSRSRIRRGQNVNYERHTPRHQSVNPLEYTLQPGPNYTQLEQAPRRGQSVNYVEYVPRRDQGVTLADRTARRGQSVSRVEHTPRRGQNANYVEVTPHRFRH